MEETVSTQQDITDDRKDTISVQSIQVEQNEDWLSKSLSEIEIKPIDFSFVAENVTFEHHDSVAM